jgi:hypothetical protein
MTVRRRVDALPSQVVERTPRPDDKHIRTSARRKRHCDSGRGAVVQPAFAAPPTVGTWYGHPAAPPLARPPLVVGSSTTEMAEGSSAQHYSLSWNPHLLQRSWRHLHPWRDANVWAQVHLSLVTTVCGLAEGRSAWQSWKPQLLLRPWCRLHPWRGAIVQRFRDGMCHSLMRY